MESIWTKTTERTHFDILKKDVQTDVLIIGGGITGILCAHYLRRACVDCVLAEADEICSGVTKNTTAKVTVLHGAMCDQMIARFGREYARLYFRAQNEALEQFRTLAKTYSCDWTEQDAVVYSLQDAEKMKREARALRQSGCVASYKEKTSLPFRVAGAVRMRDQGQIHPLKLLYALARELPIYEHTKVLELTPEGAVTANGLIKAKRIIVATHFPFLNKHGSYFLKMYQHRSYVLALENAILPDAMYVDADDRGMSFRHADNLLLLGGGGHRTGKQGGNWQELLEFAKRHYPNAREVARWATQDCMTLDGIPYIGQYSARTPNLYVATGFQKWGMTSAMVSAMLLASIIKGEQTQYEKIFSPSRSMLRPQLAINGAEALLGLLTPTAPRCPHMGCVLKYNKAEHSWDCPCHGSRFSESGELIDNPATDDKKL